MSRSTGGWTPTRNACDLRPWTSPTRWAFHPRLLRLARPEACRSLSPPRIWSGSRRGPAASTRRGSRRCGSGSRDTTALSAERLGTSILMRASTAAGLEPLLPELSTRERRSMAGRLAAAVVPRVPRASHDARLHLHMLRRRATRRSPTRRVLRGVDDRLLSPHRRHDRPRRQPLPPRPDGRRSARARTSRADRTPSRTDHDPGTRRLAERDADRLVDRLADLLTVAWHVGLDPRAFDGDRLNAASVLADPLIEAHRSSLTLARARLRALVNDDGPPKLPATWRSASPALTGIVMRHRDARLRATDRLRQRSMTGAGRRPEGVDPATRMPALPLALWPDWAIRLRPPTIEARNFRISASAALCLPGADSDVEGDRQPLADDPARHQPHPPLQDHRPRRTRHRDPRCAVRAGRRTGPPRLSYRLRPPPRAGEPDRPARRRHMGDHVPRRRHAPRWCIEAATGARLPMGDAHRRHR